MINFQNKQLNELYLSVFLRSLAISLISIFIPIYLLQLGFRIFDVALFYLIYFGLLALLTPFAMKLNAIWGVRKTMSLGILMLIIHYYLLNGLTSGSSYYLIATIVGIAEALYWSAYNFEFTNSSVIKEEGRGLSTLKIISIISGILGPFIGALVISHVSFTLLSIIVSIILFISITPLFFSKDFKVPNNKLSIKKIIHADSARKAFAYQADGALLMSTMLFWPVFIYLAIKNIVSLGAIFSITSLLTIFVIKYLGKEADRDMKNTLKIGVFIFAPFWIIRLFFFSPIGLFITHFITTTANSAIDFSFGKLIFEKAKNSKEIVNYFLFREFHLAIGRVIILVVVLLTESIQWIFILSFFISFVFLGLLKEMKQ